MSDQQPTSSAVPDSREQEDGFWARERLVFFSDAVIAIAMTLLALDLPVPKGETDGQVWRSFVDLLPEEYFFFVISFLVIARFWRSHHVFFTEATRVDTGLIRLNLWCLLLIVLVPFATRVLNEDGDFRLGVGLYAVVIAGIALSYVLMAWHATRRGLTRDTASSLTMTQTMTSMSVVAAVFLLSIAVAFVNVDAAKYTWLLLVPIRLVTVLTRRWTQRKSDRPADRRPS